MCKMAKLNEAEAPLREKLSLPRHHILEDNIFPILYFGPSFLLEDGAVHT